MSSKGVRKFKLQSGQLCLSDRPPPSTVTRNPILVALVSVCVINVVRKEALAPFNERIKISNQGLPWWRSGWESACQCGGHGFEPWSGKIPHATEQLGP